MWCSMLQGIMSILSPYQDVVSTAFSFSSTELFAWWMQGICPRLIWRAESVCSWTICRWLTCSFRHPWQLHWHFLQPIFCSKLQWMPDHYLKQRLCATVFLSWIAILLPCTTPQVERQREIERESFQFCSISWDNCQSKKSTEWLYSLIVHWWYLTSSLPS